MFSKTPEKRMRMVRGALAFGWLLLIVSLFWDPVTQDLTRPDNLSSPFHLRRSEVMIQGVPVLQVPYQMGNRIFWTMLIPLVPLFLMIAGHEAWRRICPLSFLSQIPRYLGIQRRKSVLIRRSGQVERQLALVKKDGWVKRNVWYVQFGLLFLALNARILIVNSDRTGLAVMLIGIILAAISVGYFWGGKTWCNYVCPIGIVQKIYTEPRGLLESRPHLQRQAITQSMCRTSTDQGERSICVGCTSNCPDIDLERAYWENIQDPMIRNVYYGFFGLVLGFYVFYYLYSGNWDYYFTGAWTHEENLRDKLFGPGLYLFQQAIAIPKILSAPLVLASFVGLAWLAGKALEFTYRKILLASKSALSEAEIINRCLSFSAFITINVFYVFGGRSNLNLLPPAAIRLIDFIIVCATVLWFFRAVQRTPIRYRRESLASSLMEQLRNLKIDITRYVDTPNIEQLSPDEVYVLAKTLPSFSSEQRSMAYRNILSDSIRTGRTDSAGSTERLRELRQELGVSDETHRQLLEEFGIDNASATFNTQKFASYEQWLRADNYQRAIEPLIVGEMEKGSPLTQILGREEVVKLITESRELYQISAEEHLDVIADICGQSGIVFERAKRQLEQLRDNSASRFSLDVHAKSDQQWQHLHRILNAVLLRRAQRITQRLCSILRTLGDTTEARWLARSMFVLMGEHIELVLANRISVESGLNYQETLHPHLLQLLRGVANELVSINKNTDKNLPAMHFHEMLKQRISLPQELSQLVADEDPLVCALALTGLSYVDMTLAREQAHEHFRRAQEKSEEIPNDLLKEVIENILGISNTAGNETKRQGISLSYTNKTGELQQASYNKDYITIGRAPDNDFVVRHPAVSPYHLSLFREDGHLWLKRLDFFVPAYLNGTQCDSERTNISNGCALSFAPADGAGPVIFVEWHETKANYQLAHFDSVSKLLWLSSVGIFQSLDLHTVAQLAFAADARLYTKDAWLCRAGETASEAYLIQSGTAEALAEEGNKLKPLNELAQGAIVGELGVITGRARAASVRITSDYARIVTINGERLHSLMRQDPAVSMHMLNIVANYIKN